MSEYFGTNQNSKNSGTYFAANKAEDVASSCISKARSFYNVLSSNAYIQKLINNWHAYHGSYSNDVGFGHKIDFTGEQGELVLLPVNHFRNLAQHMLVMITTNRPAMEPRAVNTDYKSLAQTYLANGILDYYMREKNLEKCIRDATELAVVLGCGYIKMEWNATGGDIYDVDPETGEFNYEGEIQFSNLTPLDVVVDGTKESWNNEWVLVRTFQNRYNLMAKYPELADKIKGIPSKSESSVYRLAVFSNDETDDIAVYEFFHKKTEALPDGRYLQFLDTDCVLLDTKLPYRDIPIYRISAGEILGTPYAYTPMFDVFPLQESINSLYSTIMTNQNAFGVQNIYVPRGADINVNTLDGAMNIIEANAKPEPLNLTNTPAEVFKFLEMMIQSAETISGINSVSRGNPEASLRSGSALALVQSMSIQFMSGLQNSYVKLIEDVGTALINMLKDYATTPKVIALVGKNNRTYLKEFTGEQIKDINRVIVSVGNPLSKTIAGRVQMAEQMLQMGLIKTPQEYFQVINTGSIESMFEGEMSELLLVKAENEKMIQGETQLTTALDDHKLHIQEHKSILADPDLRQDPKLIKIVLGHIQEHIDLLRNTDPDLLMLTGQQPLQPNAADGGNPAQGLPPGAKGMPPGLLKNPNGPPMSGDQIQGQAGKQVMPGIPRPPAPFQNNPVSPQENIPK